MIIPIPSSSSTSRCPHCNDIENIKEVCANCGHVYEQEGPSSLSVILLICVILFLIVLFSTFIGWAVGYTSSYKPITCTYWEYLVSAMKKIVELFRHIA